MRTATSTASIRRQGFSRIRGFIRHPKTSEIGSNYRTLGAQCAFARAYRATELQDKPAQIGVLGEIADVLLDIGGVDPDRLAIAVRRGKGNLVEHALHHGL